ncbi:phage portal protein [Xenorhabdus sp. ZM]|uniref:phage portal protein n=1 Tax=Xenorhabdus szentirmaii TaxID=290112 RepID=UPI0019876179|nr:phage portal protein [Xenorhabdus sp. ZM]MBD2806424.1 phage portal protein [Xenorhabdus sp. ZM]
MNTFLPADTQPDTVNDPRANLPDNAAQCAAFTFDAPTPVVGGWDLLDCMECAKNGRWYETPIDFSGLARAFSSAVYHQSPLFFKRNVIMSCFLPHPLLSRQDMAAYVLDYLVFGNAYLERRTHRLEGLLGLKHAPAKYTRRGEQPGQYWFVESWNKEFEFRPNSVFHLMNPDIHQEVYGLPEYLAGLLSANLNRSATAFRMNYYNNGSHAGVIVYLTDPLTDAKGVENLQNALQKSRRDGAFKNLFVYAANGKKDGLQILPFSQISAKDEFANVKEATRDDLLAMHRVPPQLMSIMPPGGGNLGDVEKTAKVFAINELNPIMESLKSVNDWAGQEVVRFAPYALLEALNGQP